MFGTRKKPFGPDSLRWETHELMLSGTRVSFEAPRHYHDEIDYRGPFDRDINLYDESRYGRYNKKNTSEPLTRGLIYKDWVFYGLPIIDGVIGDMKFYVSVCYLPEFKSLFRPHRFECGIERYLYASSDSVQWSGEMRKHWRIVPLNGENWVNHRSAGSAGFHNAETAYTDLWQLPITDQHMLVVQFKQIIRVKRSRLAEVYAKLIDKIMDTFTVLLSSESDHQRQHDKESHPWEILSDFLPPYTFEELEKLDEFNMFQKINRQSGGEMAYEEVDRLTQEALAKQTRDIKQIREKVLASHLRFETLEAEDLAAYKKEQAANT